MKVLILMADLTERVHIDGLTELYTKDLLKKD